MSSSPSVSARTGASTVVASSAVSSAAPSAPANLHAHVGGRLSVHQPVSLLGFM